MKLATAFIESARMTASLPYLNLPSIEHVIDRDILTVAPTMLVTDVVQSMEPHNQLDLNYIHHFCLIVDPTQTSPILGIFTERDLVRLLTQRANLRSLAISEVMTHNVITLTQSAETTIAEALSLLRTHAIHYLPVINEQAELIGSITYESIRQALQPVNLLKLRRVEDVMRSEVVCTHPQASIYEIAQQMYEQQVSSVVLVESSQHGRKATGIITEQDLAQLAFTDRDLAQTTAASVMSHPVIHVQPTDTLWHAHEQMQLHKIRRLVVVGPQSELLAIVTQTCFLRTFDPIEVAAVITTLQHQVEARTLELKAVNQTLVEVQSHLEDQVEARTADLLTINQRLQQEIEERKRSESEQQIIRAALQESEARYRSMFSALHEGIVLQGLDGEILTCNDRATPIMQMLESSRPDSAAPPPHWEAIHEDGSAFLYEERPNVLTLRTSKPCENVVMGLRHNSSLIWLSINSQPLLLPNSNQPYAVVSSFRDITEARQLQEQLLRAQRLESIGTLASGIAHDLNNIFTPILAGAQLLPLKQPDLKPQTRKILDMLENSARRGAELIKQVLSFARGSEPQKIQMDLKHIVAEVAQLCRQTFPKSIETCIRLDEQSIWSVFADPTQINQVLMNLCVNARDAMKNGGVLTIGLTNQHLDPSFVEENIEAEVGNYVILSVQDTGTGIPDDCINRIFDPFFTTKEIGQGTGLGLSTALGIIKSHNGFIKVDSCIGGGSQFQIFLPAIQTAETADVSPTWQLPRGHHETVLIIDDEQSILQIAQTVLETYQYDVLVADSGQAGLALYAKNTQTIDVVLLDIMMPEMSGISTAQKLRQLNPNVKIIICSGFPDKQTTFPDSDLSVEAFMTKPYTPGDLITILDQVLHS